MVFRVSSSKLCTVFVFRPANAPGYTTRVTDKCERFNTNQVLIDDVVILDCSQVLGLIVYTCYSCTVYMIRGTCIISPAFVEERSNEKSLMDAVVKGFALSGDATLDAH